MPQRRITTRGHKTTEAGQSFTQDPNLPPPPILRIDQEKASQDGQDNGGELDEEDSLPVRGQEEEVFPPRRTGHVQPLNDDDLMTKAHAQPLDDDDLFIQDNNNNFYQEKQDPMYQDKDFRAQPRTTPGLGQNRTTPDIRQGLR